MRIFSAKLQPNIILSRIQRWTTEWQYAWFILKLAENSNFYKRGEKRDFSSEPSSDKTCKILLQKKNNCESLKKHPNKLIQENLTPIQN